MAVAGAIKRYAQAAFNLAKQQGTLDVWVRDLEQLDGIVNTPSVSEFLRSPAVPVEAKQEALEEMLPGDERQLVRNLAFLLLERDRLHQLSQLVEVFNARVLEEHGIVIADVTTAMELNPAETDLVKGHIRQMTGNDVELRPHVDPSIIGGIVVRIGDTLIDGSVQAQLSALRQRMVSR